MPGKKPRAELSRSQILSFRRRTGALNERLPSHPDSLRKAAWAGLQDSMPRAALLSLHARVSGAHPALWEDSSLIQIWGPRFSAFVISAADLALFTLGRLPDSARGRARAFETAARLHAFLDGRRMPFGKAGHAMGVQPNSLRYATATGTVLMRWDGARQPVVWTGPAPEMNPLTARIELARRYLHIFGPATSASFQRWAGMGSTEARNAFDALAGTLTPVQIPTGEAWILTEDVPDFQRPSEAPAPARLLPSGDAYFLLWGADRQLLVPDARHQASLWTTRVWPGALLVNGEIVGVWRRAASEISVETWRPLTSPQKQAVEAEAISFPLPGLTGPVNLRWL